MAHAHALALELPVLRLGMVGFAAIHQSMLVAGLAHVDSGMCWQPSHLSAADAWFVNGSILEVLPDGSLQVGLPTPERPRPVRFNLAESERPVAFSLPMATRRLPHANTFQLNPAGIKGALERFDRWLRPLAIELCLAAYVAENNLDLNASVFHVITKGRLLAVVARNGVGVLPVGNPADVAEAEWARRPLIASEIPRHFLTIGFAQLMWQYAMRTSRDVLPSRFRADPIYWRAPPQLPHRLLLDAHLIVARALSQSPATFRELADRTRMPDPQLARCLAAFYVAGAITTDRSRTARSAPAPVDKAATLASLKESFRAGDLARRPSFVSDATAPAPLGPMH